MTSFIQLLPPLLGEYTSETFISILLMTIDYFLCLEWKGSVLISYIDREYTNILIIYVMKAKLTARFDPLYSVKLN